ncbi:hypothetical protein [Olleya sp. UBA1516]|uniref:hypothetical protein n=1 Tax=Olleya sp. UBA1516 TaxID=1947013 RepID=UPI0025E20760|nr:hypothetical protein [Olleya sp. UBA1516]|tara:strand:- start:2821 stop:3237 length:417 start_codon:yes stop_codon:yes gene_type:complete
MSNLHIISLLFDFGLVVLIWMVQLIIYPSFKYYNQEALIKWHAKYTVRIAGIVIPLMFGQLILYLYLVFTQSDTSIYIKSALTISAWIATFAIFVPLHSTINNGKSTEKTLQDLVSKNWIRTAIWTLLFIINLITIVK